MVYWNKTRRVRQKADVPRGIPRGIPWKGNYSYWLEQKKNRLQQEETAESERQKTLQCELEWIQIPPKGRHAKSVLQLLKCYPSMV